MAYNFFYILKNYDERDFYYYEYLSILSIIHTQENYNIIIYRINNVNGKYYNLLKNNSNICFRDIDIYMDSFNDKSNNYDKFKYSLINTVGGIYVDFSVIFVSSIKQLYSKHLINYNDKLIGGSIINYFLKNKNIFKNFYDYVYNNKNKFNKDDENSNNNIT